MIARRISRLAPGEHDRGIIYRGPGPLIVVGEAQVPKSDGRPRLNIGLPFGWMSPVFAPSFMVETDGTARHPGRLIAICSLVRAHKALAEVCGRLNGHSGRAHDLFLDGLKRRFDDGGRHISTVAANEDVMYVGANSIRVYFGTVGHVDQTVPVVAELAVCDGKADEQTVLSHVGGMPVNYMH